MRDKFIRGYVAALATVLILCAAPSCITMQEYDPETVQQIDYALEWLDDDWKLLEPELDDPARTEAEMRRDAERARLRAWRMAEEAKRHSTDQ